MPGEIKAIRRKMTDRHVITIDLFSAIQVFCVVADRGDSSRMRAATEVFEDDPLKTTSVI